MREITALQSAGGSARRIAFYFSQPSHLAERSWDH
jgi:lipopolysaccharide export LptBFGC system permease protein LptF